MMPGSLIARETRSNVTFRYFQKVDIYGLSPFLRTQLYFCAFFFGNFVHFAFSIPQFLFGVLSAAFGTVPRGGC
jgi:hypothetical protein